MKQLVNLDVHDIAPAEAFYVAEFGRLQVPRRGHDESAT